MADSTPAPQNQAGQGSAGSTDIATQLLGVVRQLSNAYQNMLKLIAAVEAVNFPQNVKGYTVATLPSSPTLGQIAYVTDGTSGLSWGAAATGGHSTFYIVNWNGTQWSVMGK